MIAVSVVHLQLIYACASCHPARYGQGAVPRQADLQEWQ